jgi:hypothetical protein
LELSRYVHEVTGNSKNGNIAMLEGILASLCETFGTNRNGISPHTLAVLRGLIIFVGSNLLTSATAPQPSVLLEQNLLVDFIGQDPNVLSTNNDNTKSYDDTPIFIIEHLLAIDGCYWAKCLIQPTLGALSHQYFFKSLLAKENITEYDYISIVTQFPWHSLGELPIKIVENEILLPFQIAIERLAKEKYLQALLLFVKILIFIDEKFPLLKLTLQKI